MIQIPGIQDDRLERRIAFLRSRATAHLELAPEDLNRKACAATLLRDCACIRLLMGRIREAREDLLSAGKEFLSLGLVEGAALVALANAASAKEMLGSFSRLFESILHSENRAPDSERLEFERQMSYASSRSPYQILSLLQVDLLLVKNEMQEASPVFAGMQAALDRNRGYPVGATGMSMDAYAGIANGLVEREKSELPYSLEFVMRGLRSLYTVRAENLRVAMKDRYNWQMLLRPTELLDLDSVILMYLAVGSESLERQLEEFLQEESILCQAPLIVARELRA